MEKNIMFETTNQKIYGKIRILHHLKSVTWVRVFLILRGKFLCFLRSLLLTRHTLCRSYTKSVTLGYINQRIIDVNCIEHKKEFLEFWNSPLRFFVSEIMKTRHDPLNSNGSVDKFDTAHRSKKCR